MFPSKYPACTLKKVFYTRYMHNIISYNTNIDTQQYFFLYGSNIYRIRLNRHGFLCVCIYRNILYKGKLLANKCSEFTWINSHILPFKSYIYSDVWNFSQVFYFIPWRKKSLYNVVTYARVCQLNLSQRTVFAIYTHIRFRWLL